jgi:hypothetical protein
MLRAGCIYYFIKINIISKCIFCSEELLPAALCGIMWMKDQ